MRRTAKNTAKAGKFRPPRRWLVSGAAAGVIATTGGALLVANGQSAERQAEVSGAIEPLVSQRGSGRPSAAASKAGPASPAPNVALPPLRAVTELPQSAEERLSAAKRAGADDIKPQRPLIRAQGGPASGVRVVEKGSVREDGKMLRIVSARADLTGHSELGWVADDGVPVGHARCSQNFRLSNEQAGKARPTLLVCWRTSYERSVYTVSVDLDGRPSKKASAAAIDKAWDKLG